MPDYSLNETASRAKLAAKGAGYSWGMAEEVARAVYWLVTCELPGPAMLLELLSSYPTSESVNLAIPSINHDRFTTNHEWLCPVASGCALSDLLSAVDEKTNLVMLDVKCPILLLPFLAEVAQRLGCVLVMELGDNKITTNGSHIRMSDLDCVSLEQASSVICRSARDGESAFKSAESMEYSGRRAIVSEHVWKALGTYAHRTYAPSSEHSRAHGAGAGLNDND